MLHIDTTSYISPNYDARPQGEISGIVLHSGEGSKRSDLKTLCDDTVPEEDRVSAHYYVDRAAHAYQLVDPRNRAWHAGESHYQGRTHWNDFSIGIETEHKDGQDWPEAQCAAIFSLCQVLIETYHIEQKWIAAHRWIAPGRKFDPTNWSDTSLRVWINKLYVNLSYSVPGLNGDKHCGKGFYDFYHANGGFALFGYALTDEAKDTDTLGRECTWMRFERAVFKYVYGEGVHLALLVEALAKRWLI